MFKIGEYIIHGNSSVCRIEEIGPMSGMAQDKLYYTLAPVYAAGAKVFTPVDSDKVYMRPVISQEEAEELIQKIENIDGMWVEEDKIRENMYKESLRSCKCSEWVKIIKTSYVRSFVRLQEGKKATASDQKYLHIAEENLYNELALVLGKDKQEVKKCVLSIIDKKKEFTL